MIHTYLHFHSRYYHGLGDLFFSLTRRLVPLDTPSTSPHGHAELCCFVRKTSLSLFTTLAAIPFNASFRLSRVTLCCLLTLHCTLLPAILFRSAVGIAPYGTSIRKVPTAKPLFQSATLPDAVSCKDLVCGVFRITSTGHLPPIDSSLILFIAVCSILR